MLEPGREESRAELALSEREQQSQPGLYARHEIKQELVVGPEVLQPPDFAFNFKGTEVATIKKESSILLKLLTMKQESTTEPELVIIKEESSIGDDEDSREFFDEEPFVRNHDNNVSTTGASDETIHLKPSQITKPNEEIKMHNVSSSVTANSYNSCKLLLSECLAGKDCESCKKKDTLKKRLQRHTSLKPYVCKVCKKRYAQKINLYKHARRHLKDKVTRVLCEICYRPYAKAGNLKRHMRSHDCEKPCEKSTGSRQCNVVVNDSVCRKSKCMALT